jgi:alpha-L-fucosidase
VNPPARDVARRPLPAWFDDAKFGIFFHWTPATVPAFAPLTDSPFALAERHGWDHALANIPYVEWYQNSLAIEGSPVQLHHREVWGDTPYEQFVDAFLGLQDGWSAEPWADIARDSGARYVVFVTKHHDGVLLWPSALSNPLHGARWQSRRDFVGELASAVRRRGLRFGAYYSGGYDWTFGGLPMHDLPSAVGAILQSDEYLAYADAHWRELIDRYEPSVLWNDIGYPMHADLERLFGDFYDRVPDGVVNNRFDYSGKVSTDFVTPEYSTDAPAGGQKWEATRGVGRSFGFNALETSADYLSADELVLLLVEVVANGGNVLLNVGPMADGTIPWLQAERVLALGWWLKVNGDAIYESRPWTRPSGVTRDGLEVRFTTKGEVLYAIVLGRPAGSSVTLGDVPDPATGDVRLLGYDGALRWTRRGDGVEVELPGRRDPSPAFTLRLS